MTRNWEQVLAESVEDVRLPPTVYDGARDGHRRHRSIVLTGAATSGLAVAALTAALVLPAANRSSAPEAIGSSPGSTGAPGSRSSAPPTGRHLLLAAASVAATRPAATGRYWHTVTTVQPRGEGVSRIETWLDHDGNLYLGFRGHASKKAKTLGGFELAGVATGFTYPQLAALPTDPVRLVDYLDRVWDRSIVAEGAPASDRRGGVEIALVSLLADVPAPPAVRATAFRALAQSPNVDQLRSAGNTVVLTGFGLPESKTGRAITPDTDRMTVTIEPRTSQLTRVVLPSDTENYFVAEWTNTLP